MHFIKCRNGETGIAFFKAVFENMKVLETETPPKMNLNIR